MKDLLSRRIMLKGLSALPMASLAVPLSTAQAAGAFEPSFEQPFSKNSLWNARPVQPVLGTDVIPAVNNKAYLQQGAYGSHVFRAVASDPPMVIYGSRDPRGPWISDEIRSRNITIPHFPADVTPASGTDGHCEIYDETNGLIHSFYQLKYDSGHQCWRAAKYDVMRATESGWGTPSQPDGPRAAGVSTAGGLLRIHEAETLQVHHVVALAAHANVFRSGPVFPATLEDSDGDVRYSGGFPMGTLLMLPDSFDIGQLTWPQSRAIAQALKTYGGRLVDQTQGAFTFCGEIGSHWSQSTTAAGVWQSSWTTDLTRIRDSLRAVVSASGWLDADGMPFHLRPWAEMNLLSMRGPWKADGPDLDGSGFDTQARLFLFPASQQPVQYRKLLYLRDEQGHKTWFDWQRAQRWYTNPQPGVAYRLRATGFGEASVALDIRNPDGATSLKSAKALRAGQEIDFTAEGGWPLTVITVQKPAGPPAGISLEIVKRA